MRQGFTLVSVLMFLFLVVPVAAQDTSEENESFGANITLPPIITSTPTAEIVFSEPVTVLRAEFLKLDDLSLDIEYTVDSTTTKLSPTMYESSPLQGLTNGQYYFEIEAADNVGNIQIFRKKFGIVFPTLDIQIVDPPLGVTNTTPFDLTIATYFNEELYTDAQCKYSTMDPKDNFDASFLVNFDRSEGALHTIYDFSEIANLMPNVESPGYYFICIDDDGRPTTKRMVSKIDTIPPAISKLSFDPKTIIEFPLGGGHFQTEMTIQATEPVQCRYSLNETLPFEEMKDAGDYDEEDYDSFSEQIKEIIYLPIVDNVEYEVTVICLDRAGYLTPPQTDKINVDLSASIGIHVITPQKYTLGENMTLSVSTAKLSHCEYREGNGSQIIMSTEDNPLKIHEALLGSKEEGTYSLDISCHSGAAGMFQDQTLNYKYTVDRTPPGVPTVNGSTISCSPTEIDLSPPLDLDAQDAHSGISTFEYSIPDYNISGSGSSISQVSLPEGINMTPGTVIDLSVIAVDNVGLKSSPTSVSITYDPNHPDCLEKNKPSVNVGTEEFPGEVRVTLTCTDDTGCDDASFLYGLGAGGNCTPYQNYFGTFSVYSTQTLCYSVKDVVGNEAKGSTRIVVETGPNCNNGVKDADETGVDCGGVCGATCSIGGPCNTDEDCASGYCSNGICAEPSCDDGVQNGKETGIDCGGASDCARCGIGSTCYTNSDCQSNFCHPESKTCQNSSCTDGFTGGSETDVDCGGECPACENGMKCNMDSDCLSGNCAMGYCSAETEEYEEAAEPVSTEEKGPVFPLILLLLGLFMILGGIGYLVYKHKTAGPRPPATPKTGAGVPPKPGMPPAPGVPSTQRPKAPSPGMSKEMIERMKQQRERQKELADKVRKKLEKSAKEKREKRSKMFEKFGPSRPEEPKQEKPAEGIKVKEKKPKGPKVDIKKDWVSVDDLGKAMKKQKESTPKTKEKNEEKKKEKKVVDLGEDVEMLDKVMKKEEDLFERLPGKGKETPEQGSEEDMFARLPEKEGNIDKLTGKTKEEDRDIFKRIEEKGGKGEAGDEALENLEKRTSKKNALKDLEEE